MKKNKKRKRNTLILLALLALLIGLLIPFTWRSFKSVKASLLQESIVTKINPETISGNLMHGGWVPSNTPTKFSTATNTATIQPSPTSTAIDTATVPPSPTLTVSTTATNQIEATPTVQTTSTPTMAVIETLLPSPTVTSPNNVPFGGTETPGFIETSTPKNTLTITFTLTSTQTATPTESIPPTEAAEPAATEVPPTTTPAFPPTVGPGGNPGNYSTLGFIFGLIAVAAFFLYFSGLIVSKRDPE